MVGELRELRLNAGASSEDDGKLVFVMGENFYHDNLTGFKIYTCIKEGRECNYSETFLARSSVRIA